MKKIVYLLSLTLVLGIAGCNLQAGNRPALYDCDMAIFDDGKLVFYNSTDNVFIPYEAETDYVLSGLFFKNETFFYTVSVNDELYLKSLDLQDPKAKPVTLIDWGLKLGDCLVDGRVSSLVRYKYSALLMQEFDYLDFIDKFQDAKYYDFMTMEQSDSWPSTESTVDEGELFNPEELFWAEENAYYYMTDTGRNCISDKIDFKKYASDPENAYDPQFNFVGMDPKGMCVAYSGLIEWGHEGHGPLCFATLDGKVQLALAGTDAAQVYCGWLQNGTFAYADSDGIKVVNPQGEISLLHKAKIFVTR